MAAVLPKPDKTETKTESPFVLPKTLDEWMVTFLWIAWPSIFFFVLRPNMDLKPAGEAVAWILAFAIQVGIIFAMRTARRRGQVR